jgi:hypothetical protein
MTAEDQIWTKIPPKRWLSHLCCLPQVARKYQELSNRTQTNWNKKCLREQV